MTHAKRNTEAKCYAAKRLLTIARRLYEGHSVTRMGLQDQHGISSATAKRDISLLKRTLPVTVRREGNETVLSLGGLPHRL